MTAAPYVLSPRRRFVELTVILAMSRFKLRYLGSVLGYLWTLGKPLLLFGVLYVAFTEFIRFGGDIPHYPAYLITAIVLFTYFSEATSTAVTSLVDQMALVRKVPMPLLVIPLSLSLTAAFNLLLNLVAVLVFVLASGIHPAWTWLEMPVLVGLLVLLSTALASILANLYVAFRDMSPIWEVVSQLLFWGTPILYTISFVPDSVQRLMMCNPLAVVMTEMRHAFIDPSAPSAASAIGGAPWLLAPAAVVVGVVALAILLQRRMGPLVAERL